ncbi:hypothetical protein HS1genome_0085 [Sulfodiicoccus acidiphilus]|uniref:SAM-dependent MTase RsmB/NOP-type domain-containing protein n=1 Tax=Sulfodiicoccus acidiphilus TaxID=1670455 RepID=A0A348B0J4_9CREN|nr:hypothetical protein HS1genome_0085 [Sulfodiicoccus acidiphilus]GGT86539.1 hypothetical protein GCM10007116_00610 [Sulfodiicoccus acidiphilus]
MRWAPHALVLEKSPRKPSLGATPEYLKGYYYIQGLASMLPAYALRPSSSDIVLDMAAAPGGKTTQLAQLMKNSGLIVAIEKRRDRMRSLMSNVNRMGVKNTVLLRAESSIVSKLDLKFSKIILDAPCSGEGLIAKDPSRRTKTTPEHLKRFQGIQINLLTHAIAALDEGGKLIYSTCSIAPEENEAVIDFAIENLGLKTLPLDLGVGNPGLREFRGVSFHSSIENCRRLYPHLHGTEGFFLCLLSR